MLEVERQVGDSQKRKTRGNLSPRDGILHQTVSRLPVANQVFLGSWTVDICQNGRSQRSAPQRRHMGHLRQHSIYAPRKPRGWDWGGDKMHCTSDRQALGHLSCSDLGRAQNAGPTESAPLRTTWIPELEWLRPGKYIQPRACLREFPAEQPRSWAV